MRTSRRRCVGISALSCFVITLGLAAPSAGIAGHVDQLLAAGILTGWGAGADELGDLSVPASLQGVPVTSISLGSGWALASTGTGKIVTWGADTSIASVLPRSPAPYQQLVAVGSNAAAAVTWDGHVTAWLGGNPSADDPWLNTGALTDIASIAVGQQQPYGVARATDGTIKTWGVDSGDGNVASTVPSTLANVTAVAACDDTGLALTSDGAVHAWGSDADGLVSGAPDSQVSAIACAGHTAIALRAGGIAEWGDTSGANAVPAPLTAQLADGVKVIQIEASSGGIVARDDRGGLWAWGSPALAAASAPSELVDSRVPIKELAAGSGAAYAITTAALPINKPVISGNAVVGGKLVGADADFSGGAERQPGSNSPITGQWYRDGLPIDGATGLLYRPTADDVGKQLTFRNIAVLAPNPPVVVESDPVVVGRASSSVAVTARPGRYGHATSVTVAVSSPAGVSGPVTLSVDGADAGKATLVKGSATFKLPARLGAGLHMVGAVYRGTAASAGASEWRTLTVAKATSHTKVKLPKKARKGGKVKAVVTVRASGGRATGAVTVKIGKAKGFGTVVNGKAVVTMKVAKKARRQKVVAIYSGDYNVQGSRAHAKLKMK